MHSAGFLGNSATMASVVMRNPATDAAPCKAARTSLVGSMMPFVTRFPYSPSPEPALSQSMRRLPEASQRPTRYPCACGGSAMRSFNLGVWRGSPKETVWAKRFRWTSVERSFHCMTTAAPGTAEYAPLSRQDRHFCRDLSSTRSWQRRLRFPIDRGLGPWPCCPLSGASLAGRSCLDHDADADARPYPFQCRSAPSNSSQPEPADPGTRLRALQRGKEGGKRMLGNTQTIGVCP